MPAVVPFKRAGWTGPPAQFRYEITGTLLYVTPGEFAEILLDTGLRRPKASFTMSGIVGTTATAAGADR